MCHGSLWNFHCTHLAPIPTDCICVYVPFVHHGAVGYCSNVRWCCEDLCCVFWAYRPLWIAQMITGLVPCVNHSACVFFIQGIPRSFVWVSTLCFMYMLVWSSSPCLYTPRRNLGYNFKKYYAFLRLSPESLHTNVTAGKSYISKKTYFLPKFFCCWDAVYTTRLHCITHFIG
jgi:hypothetical protein